MEPERRCSDGMQGVSTFKERKREEDAMECSAEACGLQDKTYRIGMQEGSTVAFRWYARGKLLTIRQQRTHEDEMQE
jgi:hypothetical protein